jgi:hypothetical protein
MQDHDLVAAVTGTIGASPVRGERPDEAALRSCACRSWVRACRTRSTRFGRLGWNRPSAGGFLGHVGETPRQGYSQTGVQEPRARGSGEGCPGVAQPAPSGRSLDPHSCRRPAGSRRHLLDPAAPRNLDAAPRAPAHRVRRPYPAGAGRAVYALVHMAMGVAASANQTSLMPALRSLAQRRQGTAEVFRPISPDQEPRAGTGTGRAAPRSRPSQRTAAPADVAGRPARAAACC